MATIRAPESDSDIEMESQVKAMKTKLKTTKCALVKAQKQMEEQRTRTRQSVLLWKQRQLEANAHVHRYRKERDKELQEISSQLLFVEGELKREKKDIEAVLLEKDAIIAEQEKKIKALEKVNNRLVKSLADLKEKYLIKKALLNAHLTGVATEVETENPKRKSDTSQTSGNAIFTNASPTRQHSLNPVGVAKTRTSSGIREMSRHRTESEHRLPKSGIEQINATAKMRPRVRKVSKDVDKVAVSQRRDSYKSAMWRSSSMPSLLDLTLQDAVAVGSPENLNQSAGSSSMGSPISAMDLGFIDQSLNNAAMFVESPTSDGGKTADSGVALVGTPDVFSIKGKIGDSMNKGIFSEKCTKKDVMNVRAFTRSESPQCSPRSIKHDSLNALALALEQKYPGLKAMRAEGTTSGVHRCDSRDSSRALLSPTRGRQRSHSLKDGVHLGAQTIVDIEGEHFSVDF